MNKREFQTTISKLDMVYTVFSRATRLPFVVCDSETCDDKVYIFTEEDKAVAYAKQLVAEHQPSFAVKVEKEMMLKMFTDLYSYGVNALEVTSGDDHYMMQLEELVRRPDFSKLPNNQRPLENPQLQISLLYLMQEVGKGKENMDPAQFKELEEEMWVNMMRAHLFLPYKSVEADGKENMQFYILKMKNGDSLVPICTDAVEFTRFRGKEDVKALVTTFEKLEHMELPEGVSGFAINPSSVALPVKKEIMQQLLKLFG